MPKSIPAFLENPIKISHSLQGQRAIFIDTPHHVGMLLSCALIRYTTSTMSWPILRRIPNSLGGRAGD